jgi:site-specific DNA recombinase
MKNKIKNNKITTGIIYFRVSSDEQVKGTSLDEQLSACQRYCEEKGIKVLEIFREEGESAKSTDRQKFLGAIEYCRKNKVDAFVVWKVDRFARNMTDHYAVKNVLLKYGTKLHSVTEQIGDDPTGKLLEGMMAIIAEFDNDIRKLRCSGGMLGRLKGGIYPWKPPVGYLSEHNKKQDKKKERPDPIDPVNFPILKRALKELAKGQYTLTEFADALNRYGLKTTKGGQIDLKFVDRILSRHLRFYAGILDNPFYPRDGREPKEEDGEMWYEGKHEPMITKEVLFAITEIKNGKNKKVQKYGSHNALFPLKGTLYCSECEYKLTASCSHGHGGIYPYYHCYNVNCSLRGKVFVKKAIEKDFMEYLQFITPKKEALELFKRMVIDHWTAKGKAFDLKHQQYKKELVELEAKKKRVYEMREDGEYTKIQFNDRLAEVENKIMATTISLNETQIEQFDIEATVTYATKFISNLSRIWFDLSPELKPRFQKLVFPQGVYYDAKTKFRTSKLGYIYEFIQKKEAEKPQISTYVDRTGLEPATPSLQMRCSTR